MASTPSPPRRRSAASSVMGPMTGSGSSFQSPVCRILPKGVRSTTALGSGIEWVMEMSSISKGPRAKLPDIGISVIFASPRRLASASFRRRTAAVKGVA